MLLDREKRTYSRIPGKEEDALKHVDHSPGAMVDLGLLLLRMGKRDGGLRMLEQAIGSGHPECVQRARAERVGFLEAKKNSCPWRDWESVSSILSKEASCLVP